MAGRCPSFAGLQNVDGFGQLPGAPGAAVELAKDAPGFELGVGAFAGAAEPGMSAVRLFLRGGLVPPAVRAANLLLTEVAQPEPGRLRFSVDASASSARRTIPQPGWRMSAGLPTRVSWYAF